MLTIARATAGDIDGIKQVLGETWLATYACHLSPATIEQVTTHWHAPSLLRAQIEKPEDFFAVAQVGGTIIGLITVRAIGRDALHLARLYVLPAYQGRGIGTRLLDTAIASYPDAALIRLEVEQQNADGHAYWRRRGFVDTGTRLEQVGPDSLPVISMERRLR